MFTVFTLMPLCMHNRTLQKTSSKKYVSFQDMTTEIKKKGSKNVN